MQKSPSKDYSNSQNKMSSDILGLVPVLPSANINRDVDWYQVMVGFKLIAKDHMYAILRKGPLTIHLQWHADTEDDPLLGGSVIRIFVKNIVPIYEAFVEKGTVAQDKLRMNTPWGTHEFGFYDLNKNAIFIVEDA